MYWFGLFYYTEFFYEYHVDKLSYKKNRCKLLHVILTISFDCKYIIIEYN